MELKKIELSIGEKIKKVGYTFAEEASIDLIHSVFSEHKRLRVFHYKGLKCSNPNCNNIGTRLILGIDGAGGKHWDVYTDDLILMNIDHIIPKKEKGNNTIENLQPMCYPCNTKKGHKLISNTEIK